MSENMAVHIKQLRGHSDTTEEIGGRTDVAADAGSQVTDMDQAYGLLCRPIAWLLKGPQEACTQAIEESAGALHDAGKKLGECADTYEQVDEEVQRSIQRILDELNSAPQPPAMSRGR